MTPPPQRILVAEDNELLAELLVFQLTQAGYDVVCATDGDQAFALVDELEPMVLLLDIGLPRLDGYGVMTALKQRQGSGAEPVRDLPIIVLSGRAAQNDRDRAIALGARGYLLKPFGGPELLSAVAGCLAPRSIV